MLGQAIIKCELAATQEQAAERTKSADRAARIAMWGGPGVGGITDLRAYDRAHRVDYLGIWRTRHGIGQLGNRASFGWNASSWAKIGNPPTHTEGMTVSAGQPWQHAAAVCGDADCGSMVEFQPTTIPSWQGTIRRFDAACPVDPAHPLGDQARRMLDQVRRQNP